MEICMRLIDSIECKQHYTILLVYVFLLFISVRCVCSCTQCRLRQRRHTSCQPARHIRFYYCFRHQHQTETARWHGNSIKADSRDVTRWRCSYCIIFGTTSSGILEESRFSSSTWTFVHDVPHARQTYTLEFQNKIEFRCVTPIE